MEHEKEILALEIYLARKKDLTARLSYGDDLSDQELWKRYMEIKRQEGVIPIFVKKLSAVFSSHDSST